MGLVGQSIEDDVDATLAADGDAAPVVRPARLTRGSAIGRYILVDEVGAGAVGVVFAAYDPKLDRKVALKLLEPRRARRQPSRERLQREAQALAKLGHPNVVVVYDVGVHEEQVYVAMEFVDGQTLGAWLASAPSVTTTSRTRLRAVPDAGGGIRPWREVVDVFVQAGRGLAAAHEAGLIHRDFKPDNVMLSDDGRVRVMDFGLARIGRDTETESVDPSLEVGPLTRSGALLGTPAYMSPEQFRGGEVDSRSDQFSFCVALYEALYGERPFVGETVGALVDALSDGSIREPVRDVSVPAWVRAVVARGLAIEPEDRFSSMQALLEALADDPVARRRRLWIRIGLGVAFAASSWGVVAMADEVDRRDAVIEERDAKIEEQAGELEIKNAALQEQLSRQRGLRASTLVGTRNEAEALLLGVQAVGAYAGAWEKAPPEAVAGLERVLAHDPVFVEASHVLSGHTDYLAWVTYSRDGSRLASASFDGTVRIWDAARAKPIATLDGHGDKSVHVEFTPDGERLVSANRDGKARIWDAQTGELRATLEGHGAPLYILTVSRDGDLIATGADEPAVKIWDAHTGALVRTLASKGTHAIRSVEFTPDGARLATAGTDGKARVWDLRSGALLSTMSGHEGPILAATMSADGTRLATAGLDRTARVWDVTTGDAVATLEGHSRRVSELAFSPDGKRLTTVSWDSTGRLWDLPSGELVTILEGGHGMGVATLAYSEDGTHIATGSFGGNVAVWDAQSGELRARLRGHRADVWAVTFAPGGRQVATASVDDSVRLWELPDAEVETLEGPGDELRGFSYSPDHRQLVTTTKDGRLLLWNAETSELIRVLDAWDTGKPAHVAYSRDGSRIAVSREGRLRTLDPRTGAEQASRVLDSARAPGVAFSPASSQVVIGNAKHVWTFDAHSLEPLATLEFEKISHRTYSPDDGRLLVATGGEKVEVFDPRSGERVGELPEVGPPIQHLAYAPDGKTIAAISRRDGLSVWDAETLTLRRKVRAPDDVAQLAYAPSGAHIAAGSGTEGVWIWDAQTGDVVMRIEPQAQETGRARVGYSPDGGRLVVFGSGFLRVHDAASGERLAYVDGRILGSAVFSPDGSRVTTVSSDGVFEVWDATTGEPLSRERIGVVRPDGEVDWPVPPRELTRIACTRLRGFARSYPEAKDICEPLVGDSDAPPDQLQ